MLLFFFSCFFFFFDIQYNLFFLNLNIILLKFVFDISLHQFGFFKILILLFQTPILSFPLIFPFIRPSNNLITVSFFSFFFFIALFHIAYQIYLKRLTALIDFSVKQCLNINNPTTTQTKFNDTLPHDIRYNHIDILDAKYKYYYETGGGGILLWCKY